MGDGDEPIATVKASFWKEQLRARDIRLKKTRGQNFLVDERVALRIVELLQASINCQTLVAVKVVPQVLFVAVLKTLNTGLGSQLSETIGTVKSQGWPHSSVSFCPQLMVGGVVSWTVMACVQVVSLLHESVAL